MLIKELCDGGKIEHSTKILNEMSKAGVKPSLVTYTTLISRAGAWQKVQLAEMYFRKMLEDGIPADAQAYNSLINAYAKAGETDRALKVLYDMDEANVSPTVVTFNTLIESCARTGKPQRANEVFKMMEKRGLKPDERSYSAIVQSCCQAGQVEAAFKLVQKMDADGIKVSSYTYSSLLHGLGKMGDLVRAFEILDQMKIRQLSPNVVTMSSLVYACGKHGKLDLAIKIYKEMLRSPDEEDRPNSITCSSLVDACLKEGKVAKAFAVVKDMRFRKIALTEVTYTSLITELSRLNQLDRILEAIVGEPDEVSAPASEGTLRSSKNEGYGGISALFPNSAQTISTSELDSVDSSNVSEDAPILTESAEELMEVFREKSNYKGVVSVFEAIKTRGVIPGPKVYKTLMNSLYEDSVRRSDDLDVSRMADSISVESNQGSGQKQMRHDELFRLYLVFQEMRIAGVSLDAAVFNTLINACAGVGDLDKALETVQAMQDEGIHPDVITYTSLLKACGINGCDGTVELAEEIFAQMQQKTNHFSNTVEPTELTFQRLMQVHLRAPEGQVNTKRVWELLDDMVRRGLKPGVVSYRSCVKAAVIEGDVDRSLAMLLVIRDQTRIGFDFRSWQGVLYLCSIQDRKDDEFRLRREIDEANNLLDVARSVKSPKR
jgi:leucine-rich PPR motif-containing protein